MQKRVALHLLRKAVISSLTRLVSLSVANFSGGPPPGNVVVEVLYELVGDIARGKMCNLQPPSLLASIGDVKLPSQMKDLCHYLLEGVFQMH